MTNDPQEELISAYLDGELSGDEQRNVERLLAENAEYRQLYDELRALHNTFEALPRYRLPEDLSQRVLRRAEQELLHQEGQSAGGSAAAGNVASGSNVRASDVAASGAGSNGDAPDMYVVRAPESQVPGVKPRGWRAIFWPAMVVAAALAMMFFGPKDRGNRQQIARAPVDAKPAGEEFAKSQPPAEMSAAEEDSKGEAAFEGVESYRKRVVDGKESGGSSVGGSSVGGNGVGGKGIGSKEFGSKRDAMTDGHQENLPSDSAALRGFGARSEKSGDVAADRLRWASPVDDSQMEPATNEGQESDLTISNGSSANRALGEREAMSKNLQRRQTAAAAGKPSVAERQGRKTEARDNIAEDSKAQDSAPQHGVAQDGIADDQEMQSGGVSDAPAPQAPALAARAGGVPARFAAPQGVIAADGAPAADADVDEVFGESNGVALQPASASMDDAYVIEVNLTPAAVRDQAFEKLLARHQLVQESLPQANALGLNGRADEQAAAPAGAPSPADKNKQLGAEVLDAAVLGDGELPALREVVVAATADQFVATLRDLREHSDQFADAKLGIAAQPLSTEDGARQLQADPLMFKQSAAAGAPGKDIASKGEAAAPAPIEGDARESAERKADDSSDREAGRGALKKARQHQANAQPKKNEPAGSEPTRNETAKTTTRMDDDAKAQDSKEQDAKNLELSDKAGTGEDKAPATAAEGEKPQLRAADQKLYEKTAEAKDVQPKSGLKAKLGQSVTATPSAGVPSPGQPVTAVPTGPLYPAVPARAVPLPAPGAGGLAGPGAAPSGAGGVQLQRKGGSVQLKLSPGQSASGRAPNPAASMSGAVPGSVGPGAGSGGGIGASVTISGPAPPASATPPAGVGLGRAKAVEQAPAKASAAPAANFAASAAPTVKLIFRLRLSEPAAADSAKADQAEPQPAAAEPAATAPPADPAANESP